MGAAAQAKQDYYDLDGLARATGVSMRTVRRWIDDVENPLPSHNVRVGAKDRGRVIIARDEFDAWVKRFPAGTRGGPVRNPDLDARVAEAARSMRGSGR